MDWDRVEEERSQGGHIWKNRDCGMGLGGLFVWVDEGSERCEEKRFKRVSDIGMISFESCVLGEILFEF